MRIAVVSDIHGNLPALEAVLAALSPYDELWQLGDIVGYGPQPDEVIARLRTESAKGVRGNHDAAALGQIDVDAFNEDARKAVLWTAARLGADARGWLAGLPERATHAATGSESEFTLAHGSPRDPTWEYVYSIGVARANFSAFATEHCIVGHTHVPLVFRAQDGEVNVVAPNHGSVFELDGSRTILNPGSVGQPRDGDPRACGMVLDTERGSVEWHRVEYGIDRVQRLMTEAGLPPRLIARLSHGL